MRRAAALVLASGLGLGGCVAQQSHDQLMDANRSLTERNSELSHKVAELENENGLMQKVDPLPGPSLAAVMVPPCASIRLRAIARPRPRPVWARVVPESP